MNEHTKRGGHEGLWVLLALIIGSSLVYSRAAEVVGGSAADVPAPIRLSQGPPTGGAPSGAGPIVQIQVTKCDPKPVRGAHVIVKEVDGTTVATRTTDTHGVVKITFESAPGQILVQVIPAAGEKVFGQKYTVDPRGSEIKVLLGQQ